MAMWNNQRVYGDFPPSHFWWPEGFPLGNDSSSLEGIKPHLQENFSETSLVTSWVDFLQILRVSPCFSSFSCRFSCQLQTAGYMMTTEEIPIYFRWIEYVGPFKPIFAELLGEFHPFQNPAIFGIAQDLEAEHSWLANFLLELGGFYCRVLGYGFEEPGVFGEFWDPKMSEMCQGWMLPFGRRVQWIVTWQHFICWSCDFSGSTGHSRANLIPFLRWETGGIYEASTVRLMASNLFLLFQISSDSKGVNVVNATEQHTSRTYHLGPFDIIFSGKSCKSKKNHQPSPSHHSYGWCLKCV